MSGGEPPGSAMKFMLFMNSYDRFRAKMIAVKYCREHSIKSNKSTCDPYKILSAPFKPAPFGITKKGLEPQKVNIKDFMLRSVWEDFWRYC